MRKALDAKMRCAVLFQYLSYAKLGVMLEDERAVVKMIHCPAMEDMFPLERVLDVMHVSSSELEELLLYDCDESSVKYVPDGSVLPVLNLTGEIVSCGEIDGHSDFR